jgi:hypothetical protein
LKIEGISAMLDAVKQAPMIPEVAEQIALRHSAEQRGNFSPIGRLLWLKFEQGVLGFRADGQGAPSGPVVAGVIRAEIETETFRAKWPDPNAMLILGSWPGFPSLRRNTSKSCPKCLHACDGCQKGRKLCSLCGGKGWIGGNWLPCPGPGCNKETGNFKGDCRTCNGTGQVPEHNPCSMCDSTGKEFCPKCRGTGKYSTGKRGGSVDWDSPRCKACDGTTYVGKWAEQDLKKFTINRVSILKRPGNGYFVLGPILAFGLRDCEDFRERVFVAEADDQGSELGLLVPASAEQRPQKAYLVGGFVREVESAARVSA